MCKRITLLLLTTFALTAGSAFADGNPARGKGPFLGAVHAVASVTYKDSSQKSWVWDRGKITALSADSITLTRRDKQQVTFVITSSTVVRNDGATYQLSDLKVGMAATVISQDGNAILIRNLRGDGAPSGGDPSAFDGPLARSVTGTVEALYADGSEQSFQYDRGIIAQVGNGQMTVRRVDGEQLSFTYDSSTVVRDCKGQLESTDDLTAGEAARFFSQSGSLKLVGCLKQPRDHGPGTEQSRQVPPVRAAAGRRQGSSAGVAAERRQAPPLLTAAS